MQDNDDKKPTYSQPKWKVERLTIGDAVFNNLAVYEEEDQTSVNRTLSLFLRSSRRRNQSRYPEPLATTAPARLLSVEAADFIRDMERRKLNKKSIELHRRVFRWLMLASGDIPVSEINASHINEFWDVLRWWPAHAGNSIALRGLSDRELLDIGKRSNKAPPARGTMEAAKRFLGVFFNRLVRMKVLSVSPLEGFGEIRDDFVENGRRRPFTKDELNQVFDYEHFGPWAMKAPHRWWGPMIALYTGARATEIAQLKLADIVRQGDIWCFWFRKTEDADLVASPNENVRSRQQKKNKSSIRCIPIAKPLLDAGFLEFVEDAKKAKHPRLFPHLSAGISRKTGKLNGSGYGEGMIAQFSKFLKETHSMDKGLAFHAFRHLLVTSLDEVGVDRDLIATITGHSFTRKGLRDEPVMVSVYLHTPAAVLRARQLDALCKFDPGIALPAYRRGQFAKCYGPRVRLHP